MGHFRSEDPSSDIVFQNETFQTQTQFLIFHLNCSILKTDPNFGVFFLRVMYTDEDRVSGVTDW